MRKLLFPHHEQTNIIIITLVTRVCGVGWLVFVLVWEACSLVPFVSKLYLSFLNISVWASVDWTRACTPDPRWAKFCTPGSCICILFQPLQAGRRAEGLGVVAFTGERTGRWRSSSEEHDEVGGAGLGRGLEDSPTLHTLTVSIRSRSFIHLTALITVYKYLFLSL